MNFPIWFVSNEVFFGVMWILKSVDSGKLNGIFCLTSNETKTRKGEDEVDEYLGGVCLNAGSCS